MLVAELHQVLMDHEISCHCTCFSLQLGGVALDGLAELRCVQGMQDAALVKVVEGNCLILFVCVCLSLWRETLWAFDFVVDV